MLHFFSATIFSIQLCDNISHRLPSVTKCIQLPATSSPICGALCSISKEPESFRAKFLHCDGYCDMTFHANGLGMHSYIFVRNFLRTLPIIVTLAAIPPYLMQFTCCTRRLSRRLLRRRCLALLAPHLSRPGRLISRLVCHALFQCNYKSSHQHDNVPKLN